MFDVFTLPLIAGDPATALNRPNTIVLDRIPVVLSAVRNLLVGLGKAGDQKRAVGQAELKELVMCAHQFDR